MRSIILVALLFSSLASCSQSPATTTLEIDVNDCRVNQHSFPRIKEIKLYKLPENRLLFKINLSIRDQFPIELENVTVGKYLLVFQNNFNQKIEKEINLTSEEVNTIEVCPDQLAGHPQNTLARLQDDDTLSINFRTQGCFHWGASKIIIKKQGERYLASLYEINWDFASGRKKPAVEDSTSGHVKTVELTQEHLDAFIRFENELNFAGEGGCTTTDWYDIQSRYLNKKATDGSCLWRGFYYLSKAIFGDL